MFAQDKECNLIIAQLISLSNQFLLAESSARQDEIWQEYQLFLEKMKTILGTTERLAAIKASPILMKRFAELSTNNQLMISKLRKIQLQSSKELQQIQKTENYGQITRPKVSKNLRV